MPEKIYGIIGDNGCGKSTFLNALIGLKSRRKDRIFFQGCRLNRRDRLSLSALVMQDVNHQLFTNSLLSEVSLGLKTVDTKKRRDVLETLGLLELSERHPMSLSGGEKQRVAIASVLLSDKTIIAFDEPTSGMDFRNMMAISSLIRGMAEKGKIIFVISHDREFLNQTADYLIDMRAYRLG